MTAFIRVRASSGPLHEYHAPVSAVERWPDQYVVIDDIPVTSPQPVKYINSPKPTPAKGNKSVGKTDKGDG